MRRESQSNKKRVWAAAVAGLLFFYYCSLCLEKSHPLLFAVCSIV